VIVRDSTRYETIDDLKRRTVLAATDDPTAAPFLQQFMGHVGFESARKAAPLAVQAGLQRLADGQIDALVVAATPPAQAWSSSPPRPRSACSACRRPPAPTCRSSPA